MWHRRTIYNSYFGNITNFTIYNILKQCYRESTLLFATPVRPVQGKKSGQVWQVLMYLNSPSMDITGKLNLKMCDIVPLSYRLLHLCDRNWHSNKQNYFSLQSVTICTLCFFKWQSTSSVTDLIGYNTVKTVSFWKNFPKNKGTSK
jgi:hypothetical protein